MKINEVDDERILTGAAAPVNHLDDALNVYPANGALLFSVLARASSVHVLQAIELTLQRHQLYVISLIHVVSINELIEFTHPRWAG